MRIFKIAGISILIALFLSTGSFAIRKPSEKNKTPRPYVPITYSIGINLNTGIVTGDYGDYLKGFDGTMADQMFFGYGACFDYHFKAPVFLSLDFERNIKSVNDHTITATMFGLGVAYKLKKESATFPYIGAGFGLVSGDVEDYDRDFGSSKYIMFKLGHAIINGSKVNTKFEAYFRSIMVSDEVKAISPSDAGITIWGARFILGIGF